MRSGGTGLDPPFLRPGAVLDAFSERRIPTVLPRMVRTEKGVGIVAAEAE